MGGPPFEKSSKPGKATIYALRLGNAAYPHMKLQVQAWPNKPSYLLSVNTHDQAPTIDPKDPEAELLRALQRENQKLKERIEAAWDTAGLPTFLRYLRDYVEGRIEQVVDSASSDNVSG